MRKKYFLVTLCMAIMQLTTASAMTDFTGKVIDSETGEPVALVTIHSNSVYTATNMEGEYQIQPKSEEEQIILTHISYETQTIDFNKLPELIKLKPRSIELAELIVTPRSRLVAELKEVWKKYAALTTKKQEKNYPVQSFYYRQLTKYDQSYTEYIESFFTAPTTVSVRNMVLQEGRFAKVHKDSVPTFSNYFYFSQVPPFSNQKVELKKGKLNSILCEDFEDYYDIYLDRVISSHQEDEVRVYDITPINAGKDGVFLAGKLFIRTRDKSIIRAEIQPPSVGVAFGNAIKVLKEESTYILSYRDGVASYPIVESVQGNTKLTLAFGNETHEMHITSTLFATDLQFDKKGNKMKHKDMLLQEIEKSKYNSDFWDNNPIIKRTKIEQKVLDDFKDKNYFGSLQLGQ